MNKEQLRNEITGALKSVAWVYGNENKDKTGITIRIESENVMDAIEKYVAMLVVAGNPPGADRPTLAEEDDNRQAQIMREQSEANQRLLEEPPYCTGSKQPNERIFKTTEVQQGRTGDDERR